MRKTISAIALIAATMTPGIDVLGQTYTIPENTPAHIRRGVESDARTPAQVARDAGRMPAEVLTLANLNEGDHIAELSTFGQYYTEMLVEAVGLTGKVEMYDLPVLAAFRDGTVGEASQAFADAHANAEYHIAKYSEADFPANLDAVYIVLSYHDLPAMEDDTMGMNSNVFNALRPGGKFLVIDHNAQTGSGWRDSGTIHRIEKDVIIEEVTAAGFELIEDSELLANPDDDHSVMVFGMRGDTDRSLLVFQKPY